MWTDSERPSCVMANLIHCLSFITSEKEAVRLSSCWLEDQQQFKNAPCHWCFHKHWREKRTMLLLLFKRSRLWLLFMLSPHRRDLADSCHPFRPCATPWPRCAAASSWWAASLRLSGPSRWGFSLPSCRRRVSASSSGTCLKSSTRRPSTTSAGWGSFTWPRTRPGHQHWLIEYLIVASQNKVVPKYLWSPQNNVFSHLFATTTRDNGLLASW